MSDKLKNAHILNQLNEAYKNEKCINFEEEYINKIPIYKISGDTIQAFDDLFWNVPNELVPLSFGIALGKFKEVFTRDLKNLNCG